MSSASVAEQVSAVLPDLYALAPEEEYPARAIAAVRRLVGGTKCDYTEVDLATGDFRVLVHPEPPQLAALAEARRAYMHGHPVLTHFLARPGPGARCISDFLTRREFCRTNLYGEFFAQLAVDHQMTALVTPPTSHRRRAGISIDRDGDTGFGEHDRRLMDALQPHLVAARLNAIRFSRALGVPLQDPSRVGAGLERLTPRQREILALVSAGSTNAQIALALDISVGTVRKHVEHILRALRASTRTGAAALYLRAGASSAATPWTATVGGMVAGA